MGRFLSRADFAAPGFVGEEACRRAFVQAKQMAGGRVVTGRMENLRLRTRTQRMDVTFPAPTDRLSLPRGFPAKTTSLALLACGTDRRSVGIAVVGKTGGAVAFMTRTANRTNMISICVCRDRGCPWTFK